MTSIAESPATKRSFRLLMLFIVVVFVGTCGWTLMMRRRPTPVPPSVAPPSINVATGPSQWMWRGQEAPHVPLIAGGLQGVPLDLMRPSCPPNDPIYRQVGGHCAPFQQPLVALLASRAFHGAPRRYDATLLATLLAPSIRAGEPQVDEIERRNRALVARGRPWVSERDASWCTFALETQANRTQLRADCALDRLDLYMGSPPRVTRTQSCGANTVDSCGTCDTQADCQSLDGCGCAQSRCVRGQCTACPPQRVCAEANFSTQAPAWTVRTAVETSQLELARALIARPSGFQTVLQFEITGAHRNVTTRSNGTVEFDTGYRLAIRPLSFAILLCGESCRQSTRAVLPVFAQPRWRGVFEGHQADCVRGICTLGDAPAGSAQWTNPPDESFH
ncbi:MAG: hypothetical protein Q8Q09_02610 [Deltaproteobacteria bacterium]|nr:hypothetical protein [Deltaproteobacteria bacterium]